MSKAEINIQLHSGEPGSEGWQFRPGDGVRGVMTVMPLEDMNSRSVYIVLQWRTRGRGTPHIKPVHRLDVHQGELKANWPLTFDFEFILPQEPWSYSGHYINVHWEIMGGIDLAWQSDPATTIPLLVSPQR